MPSSSRAEEDAIELSFRRMSSLFHKDDHEAHDYTLQPMDVDQHCTSSPKGFCQPQCLQRVHHASWRCSCCLFRRQTRSWTCCQWLDRVIKCLSCIQRRRQQQDDEPPHEEQEQEQEQEASVAADVDFEVGRRWWTRRLVSMRMARALWAFWIVCVLVFGSSLVTVGLTPPRWRSFMAVVMGSVLTLLASCMVMLSYLWQTKARRYPNEFLFLVAFCEVAVALQELIYSFYFCLDPPTTPDADNNNTMEQVMYSCQVVRFSTCCLLNGFSMVLLCASLGWFAAAICHLYASITNPFRDYNAQLVKFHAVIWSFSVVLASITGLVVFSTASQARYAMSAQEICQAIQFSFPQIEGQDANKRWRRLNISYWGPLFALCVAVVLSAQVILLIGYWRSKSGTIIALRARRHMMRRMRAYVLTLLACWLVLLVVFGVYWCTFSNTSTLLGDCLRFLISAKGFFTCIMWFGVNQDALFGFFASTLIKSSACCVCLSDDSQSTEAEPQCSLGTEDALVSFSNSQQDTIGSNDSSMEFACTSVHVVNPVNSIGTNCEALNNETLQREIVYYTVSGITKAILQSANASEKVLFQQLLVGNDTCNDNDNDNSIVSRGGAAGEEEDDGFGLEMSMSSTALLASGHEFAALTSASPRVYCCNTINATNHGRAMDPANTITTNDATGTVGARWDNSMTMSGSFTSRFSLYPVSQVPFELFENELELHSHHSQKLQSSPLIGGEASSCDPTPVSPPPTGQLALQTSFEEECHSPITSPRMPPPVAAAQLSCAAAPTPPAWSRSRLGLSRLQRAATFSFRKRHPHGRVKKMQPKVFVDYLPNEFRQIRHAFGIYDGDYLASFRTTAKERVSAGSSGAFLFFSGDNSLIVKSLCKKECLKLVDMVPKYLAFILANPRSRLIRFFGCHRICLYGRNFYFAVMANVLHSANHCANVEERYDIKGSFVDRQARLPQAGDLVTCSECFAKYVFRDLTTTTTTTTTTPRTMMVTTTTTPRTMLPMPPLTTTGVPRITSRMNPGSVAVEMALESPQPPPPQQLEPSPIHTDLSRLYLPMTGHVHQPDVILKDLDLVRRFHLSESTARKLYSQLVADSDFLCALGIMDYSLLIGVHKCPPAPAPPAPPAAPAAPAAAPDLRSSSDSMPIPFSMLQSFGSSMSMLSSSFSSRSSAIATWSKLGAAKASDDSEHLAPFGSIGSLRRWHRNDPVANEQTQARASAAPVAAATTTRAHEEEEDNDAEEVYFIGIIDVLQEWDLEKRLERFVKITLGKPQDGISAMEPLAYRHRFQAKCREILGINCLDLV